MALPAASTTSWVSNLSGVIATTYVIGSLWIEPDLEARTRLHELVVFSFGYGHLLSSVMFHQGRRIGDTVRPLTVRTGLLGLGYLGYVQLCSIWQWLPILLLVVSVWHTVENDRAIRRASIGETSAIAPPSFKTRELLTEGALTLALAAIALLSTFALNGLSTIDVVTAFILHHLASWLVLTVVRARSRRRVATTLLALARIHLPMMTVCVLAEWQLAGRLSAVRDFDSALALIMSPGTYLFWSAAHVIHTVVRRRRAA